MTENYNDMVRDIARKGGTALLGIAKGDNLNEFFVAREGMLQQGFIPNGEIKNILIGKHTQLQTIDEGGELEETTYSYQYIQDMICFVPAGEIARENGFKAGEIYQAKKAAAENAIFCDPDAHYVDMSGGMG